MKTTKNCSSLVILVIGLILITSVIFAEEKFEDYLKSSEELEHPLLEKVFPGVEFFVETSKITMPISSRIVGKFNDDKTYLMPWKFNILFQEIEKNSKASIEERIESFILLTYWLKDNNVELLSNTTTSKKFGSYTLNREVKVKVNEKEFEILLLFKDNQIIRAEIFIEGVKKSLITPELLGMRDVDISIDGVAGVAYPPGTHYYIPVSDNGSTTNDTIRFNFTGLQPNQQNVYLQVKPIYGYSGAFFLDQILNVNGSGNASYTWTPPNDDNTAICEVQVDTSGTVIPFNDIWIIPEHTLTGTFNSGYDYTVFFTNQFFSYHSSGITHAPTFAGYTETALTESWDDQVNNWSLAQGLTNNQPEDSDDNYEIGINDHDSNHRYHGTYDNHAFGGSSRKIGIRYDSYITQPLYSSELMRIKVAMCHEFYHGIQYGHNSWSSGHWLTEGQARALPSIQYQSEEYLETIQHFYPVDSNNYLNFYLNTSLLSVSYRYCLYWRFLFEHYRTGTTAQKLEIFREACQNCNSETLPAIESGMNTALGSTGGVYSTMDASIETFTKNAYLNDPTYNLWNPCPSNDFYTSPPISNDNNSDGITNTFSGNTIIEPNSIPSSFGIDYMVFDFDEEVNFVSLHFEGDPDDDGDMADFYVNVLFFEGTTFDSESEITLTDGEGTIGFEVNNPIDKAVVTIARLDTDESTSDNDYFIKLTQGIDVSLVIDRSGSMGGDEIVQAKNASNQFVALLNHGDNIAVSSFESSASVNFSLTTIESDQTKIDAQNAINSINASGGTSIGAGLQTGQGELNDNPNPNYPQAMILLSDGQENEAPMVADILPTIPDETDIYTIGLGSGADALLLSQIANFTDGFYSFSPGPNGLSNIFNTIMQKVSNNQQIANFPGTISGSRREEILHDFTIDGSMQETTFSLLWQNSSNDLDLELIAPDSTIIDPSYAATDPYISFSSFPATEFYTVTLPDSGQWTLKVIGVSISGTEDYVASVSGYSGLELDIAFDNDNYIGQDTVTVTAILTDEEVPILGATVEAEIETPTRNEGEILKEIYNCKKKNGLDENFILSKKIEFENHKDRSIRTDYLTLYDDGIHGDGDANDGVYGNFFTNTATVGSYSFSISASGTSPTAGPFTRQSFRSIFIQEPPEIDFSTTIIDFGDVIVNTTGTFDLSIYNTASSAAADLDVNNIQSTDPLFQPDTTEFSILAGNAETLTITFSPTVIDSFECNLLMQSNDPDEHSIQLTMRGNCVPPPDIDVSVDSLTMTLDEGTSNDTTFTIYNTGGYFLDYSISLQDTSSILRDYVTIGVGGSVSTSTNDTPFGTYYEDGQNQYLFTANELSTAGLTSGYINTVGWNIASAASQVMNGFNIELKHTTATSVTGFETGFTNCYSGTWTASSSWNDISFTTPFTWNGTSNLLVKICFDNTSYTSNSSCYIDPYTAMNGWAYNDGTSGCSDPYEGTINSRPQTRFLGSTNNWLSVYPSSGVVSPSDSINVIVSFNAEEIEFRETFTCQIVIESNDPDESVVNIPVIMNANPSPVLSLSNYSCDDDSTGSSMGDGNGRWEPNEIIEITLDVTNTGSLDAELVTGTLSISDIFVTTLESTTSFGNIISGDTLTCVTPLLIEIMPDAPDSHLVSLDIEISDDYGRIWNFVIEEYIHLDPDITVYPSEFDETLATGDTLSNNLTIFNYGRDNLIYSYIIEFQTNNRSNLTKNNQTFHKLGEFSEDTSNNFSISAIKKRYNVRDRELKKPVEAPFTKIVVESSSRSLEYTVDLYDDYGDGWNGGSLDLFVNSSVVLNDITLDSGSGPATFTFDVSSGDQIYTEFTAGGWPYECSYYIYDADGIQVASDGEGGVEPTGIDPFTVNWFNWLTLNGETEGSGSIYAVDSLVISVEFDATELIGDIYYAEIIISSNDPNIPEITVPVTLQVIGTIGIPQNVTIKLVATGVLISWDEVTDADSYIIFASDNPYGTFEDVSGIGSFNGTNWTTTWTSQTIVNKKFYYVVASSEMREFSPITSQRPKVISKKFGENNEKPKTSDKSVIKTEDEPKKKKAKIEWKK